MFRQFIHLAAVVLLSVLPASCGKPSQPSPSVADNADGRFTASIMTGDTPSKSFYDKDGAGAYVNRCKLQVWSRNPETGKDEMVFEKCTIVFEKEADHGMASEFKGISLAKGRDYDFLFWADCADKSLSDLCYDTSDLHDVRMLGAYAGNDDRRDAFFASKTFTVTEDFSETAALTRPFAQLNIVSTDLKFLLSAGGVAPSDTKVTFSAPAGFNVLSGQPVGSSQAFTSNAPVYRSAAASSGAAAVDERYTLSMDYVFASVDEGRIPSVGFVASNAGGGMAAVTRTFNDVPVVRNCRTDIYGALLTGGKETVAVSSSWNAGTEPGPDDQGTYPYGSPGEAGPEMGGETIPGW